MEIDVAGWDWMEYVGMEGTIEILLVMSGFSGSLAVGPAGQLAASWQGTV
jgi:hypothetical protein